MPVIQDSVSGAVIRARVPEQLCRRLRFYRRLMDLSLEQLRTRTGLSRKTISDLENNLQANPSFRTLQLLARGLEVPLAALVEGLDLEDT